MKKSKMIDLMIRDSGALISSIIRKKNTSNQIVLDGLDGGNHPSEDYEYHSGVVNACDSVLDDFYKLREKWLTF